MSNFYKMNRTCDFKVKLKESMNKQENHEHRLFVYPQLLHKIQLR